LYEKGTHTLNVSCPTHR